MTKVAQLDSTGPVSRCDDDTTEYETIDEAIAAALGELSDGGIVAIHESECSVEEDGETGCDCDVLEIRKGPRA